MADLGTIPAVWTPEPQPVPLFIVSNYQVHRGIVLGNIPVKHVLNAVDLRGPLTDYVVRQIRVIYRQLWPNHGQRFPQ